MNNSLIDPNLAYPPNQVPKSTCPVNVSIMQITPQPKKRYLHQSSSFGNTAAAIENPTTQLMVPLQVS